MTGCRWQAVPDWQPFTRTALDLLCTKEAGGMTYTLCFPNIVEPLLLDTEWLTGGSCSDLSPSWSQSACG